MAAIHYCMNDEFSVPEFILRSNPLLGWSEYSEGINEKDLIRLLCEHANAETALWLRKLAEYSLIRHRLIKSVAYLEVNLLRCFSTIKLVKIRGTSLYDTKLIISMHFKTGHEQHYVNVVLEPYSQERLMHYWTGIPNATPLTVVTDYLLAWHFWDLQNTRISLSSSGDFHAIVSQDELMMEKILAMRSVKPNGDVVFQREIKF